MAGFFDANIVWSSDIDLLKSKVTTLAKLGYENFAINYIVSDLWSLNQDAPIEIAKPIDGKKNKKTKMNQYNPSVKTADEIVLNSEDLPFIWNKKKKIKQYSRITASSKDVQQFRELKGKNASKFDIVAVQVHDEKTLINVCANVPVDIICLNMAEQFPFKFHGGIKRNIKLAISRGVYFEISYTPAILDQTKRRHTFSNVAKLLDICKGKNLIVSSACESSFDLRGPYDVANLGQLLGLPQDLAKAALTTNCRSMLLHAAARNAAEVGSAIQVVHVNDVPSSDIWKIKSLVESSTNVKTEEVTHENNNFLESNLDRKTKSNKKKKLNTPFPYTDSKSDLVLEEPPTKKTKSDQLGEKY